MSLEDWQKIGLTVWFASGLLTSYRLHRVISEIEDEEEMAAFKRKHPWAEPTFIVVTGVICGPLILLTAFCYAQYLNFRDRDRD